MRSLIRRTAPLAMAATALACAPVDGGYESTVGEVVICGHGPTVEGIDVSSWQSTIDWGSVAGSGIRFAIVRIGDGYGHDSQFAANWEGARANGLIRGAYQFFEPGDDPIRQADIVVAAVGRLGPGDLPVTCDVEAPSPSVSPAEYTSRIHQWADRVAAGTGRQPMIYTGRYYWDPYVASSDFVGLPLWHAQYTSAACPNIDDRWSDWAFWQYTSSGSIPGISGNVDRNRFNGTYEELQALADVALCDAHCEGSVIVDASCGRGDCAAYGSRCVDDALGARCAFYACPDTGDSTVCIDDHTIGNCHDGAISTGDCAAYASRCTATGGPARCAFFACPDVGDTTVCLPDGHTLGTCHDGAISTGDCAAYGALCSSTGADGAMVAGHCASVFCVAAAGDTPVAHDTCLPNGQLVHCTDTGGLENAHDCAAGSTCVQTGTTGTCFDPSAPPPDAGMGSSMGGGHADAGTTMHVGDGGVLHGDAAAPPMRTGMQISGGCSVSPTGSRSSGLLAVSVLALVLGVLRAGTRRGSRRCCPPR
jgi:GH25 family lysozyme M1 (1,4-beta-N-acetylmuramidase)